MQYVCERGGHVPHKFDANLASTVSFSVDQD